MSENPHFQNEVWMIRSTLKELCIMEQGNFITIQGTVEAVTFRGERGFTVAELGYGNELVTIVGDLVGIEEGEELKLTGQYTTHPKYGAQFKVMMFERKLPASASAICKYLSSGVIKGIGPATAKRIVETFGDEALEIIEQSPIRLAEIKGISEKKATQIGEDFQHVFGIRTLMIFLSKYGIPPAQSVVIWKLWGSSGMDLIQANPYILCGGEANVDFNTCDMIAQDLNLPEDSIERKRAGIEYVLRQNLQSGHTCLPEDKLLLQTSRLLQLSEEGLAPAIEMKLNDETLQKMSRNKDYLYLSNLYVAEQYIAERITAMTRCALGDNAAVEKKIEKIEKANGIQYADLQKKAICQAIENDIMIMTGGPGTGKTTTLNAIITILEESGKEVMIAAPTGRAAKRISEVTGKEAKTIHRMLEVNQSDSSRLEFVHNQDNPLNCDAVIIDEMSMVDTLLFDSLLRAIRLGCKLILVGDSDQLPSVGAGNVLRDLIDSECVPTVQLKEIFRQAAQSLIVTNAHKIVNGEIPDLKTKDNDFFFLPRTSSETVQETVIDLVSNRLPASYGFSPTENIQVLCPSRKGGLGTIELNASLQEILNPQDEYKSQFSNGMYLFREGDKVMQVKNNYDIEWRRDGEHGLGIFNGDIGFIKMIDRGSQTLMIDFDGRVAAYSFDMANELELAYAVTIHKSQGSEFDAVVIPLFSGFDKLFYRNLLYTAVTRAKKLLILVGSAQRIAFMVGNNRRTLRYTGLKHLLKEYYNALNLSEEG